MKAKSIDHMKFEGKQAVLDRVDRMQLSWFDHVKLFLDREIEIPITALALSCLVFISVLTFKEKRPEGTFYPIVVIEAGGHYEVY